MPFRSSSTIPCPAIDPLQLELDPLQLARDALQQNPDALQQNFDPFVAQTRPLAGSSEKVPAGTHVLELHPDDFYLQRMTFELQCGSVDAREVDREPQDGGGERPRGFADGRDADRGLRCAAAACKVEVRGNETEIASCNTAASMREPVIASGKTAADRGETPSKSGIDAIGAARPRVRRANPREIAPPTQRCRVGPHSMRIRGR
jgi:hypothetical protein